MDQVCFDNLIDGLHLIHAHLPFQQIRHTQERGMTLENKQWLTSKRVLEFAEGAFWLRKADAERSSDITTLHFDSRTHLAMDDYGTHETSRCDLGIFT